MVKSAFFLIILCIGRLFGSAEKGGTTFVISKRHGNALAVKIRQKLLGKGYWKVRFGAAKKANKV